MDESSHQRPQTAGPNREEQLLTQLLVHAEKQEWHVIKDILRKREVRLLANLVMLASTDEWLKVWTLLRRHERALIVKHEGPERLAIAQLGLSVRTVNILEEAGVGTVGELLTWHPGKIRDIPNCGERTIEEIVEALGAMDLSLPTPPREEHAADSLISEPQTRSERSDRRASHNPREAILEVLRVERELPKKSIKTRTGLAMATIDSHLQNLVIEGLVARSEHGTYVRR